MSKLEDNWIRRLRRLIKDQPDTLLLYSTDGEIIVCERGVSSEEFCEVVPDSHVSHGCVLTDLHDDSGFGE